MSAAAAGESTSTDSAGLSQCSTVEEQAQTPSPQCPPASCKLAAVSLIQLSDLSVLVFLLHPATALKQKASPLKNKTLKRDS